MNSKGVTKQMKLLQNVTDVIDEAPIKYESSYTNKVEEPAIKK